MRNRLEGRFKAQAIDLQQIRENSGFCFPFASRVADPLDCIQKESFFHMTNRDLEISNFSRLDTQYR